MMRRLLSSSRAALQWRLLLLWTVCLLIPAAIMSAPVWQLLGQQLDHSVHAASLAQELDLVAITDLLDAQQKQGAGYAVAGALSLLATLLLSPLMTGLTTTAARAPHTLGFAALLAGGVADYPRLLRMLIVAAIPLGAAGALGAAAMKAASRYGEYAQLESDARLASMLAMLMLALLVALANATADAGRAVLASDRRRRSAFLAWWAGVKLVLRHPRATLGGWFAISVVGLLAASVLTVARINVPTAGLAGFLGALALTQLIVAVVAWMRSARLFALIALAARRP